MCNMTCHALIQYVKMIIPYLICSILISLAEPPFAQLLQFSARLDPRGRRGKQPENRGKHGKLWGNDGTWNILVKCKGRTSNKQVTKQVKVGGNKHPALPHSNKMNQNAVLNTHWSPPTTFWTSCPARLPDIHSASGVDQGVLPHSTPANPVLSYRS